MRQERSLFFVYGSLVLVQILFGINFSTSKLIVGRLDPFLWSNIRFLAAGCGMLFLTLIFKRPHPSMNKEFLLPLIPLSFLGMGLGQSLFLFGLSETTSTNTAILTSTIPILTLLIVVITGQEEITLNKILGLILAFLGVINLRDFTTFNLGAQTFKGDLLVFLGALSFALYLSLGKKFLQKFDNMWTTTWMFFISGISMSLFNFDQFALLAELEFDQVFVACGIYTILGATLLTYFLNNWALKQVASGVIALFIYLQPLVAGLIGHYFLGEEISWRLVICGLFIMLGVLISSYKKAQKRI